MLPKDCVRLYDIMKGMKCDIFRIYKDRIIGCEAPNDSTSLTQVMCDTKIEGYIDKDNNYVYSYEIDKETMKIISDKSATTSNPEFNPEYFISKYSVWSLCPTELQLMDHRLSIVMSNKIVPDYRIDNLKENEQFMDILSSKAAEGAKFFKINKKYLLAIFSGLLPINKPDKAALELYDNDMNSFVAKFIINKGKFTMEKYIMYFFI